MRERGTFSTGHAWAGIGRLGGTAAGDEAEGDDSREQQLLQGLAPGRATTGGSHK